MSSAPPPRSLAAEGGRRAPVRRANRAPAVAGLALLALGGLLVLRRSNDDARGGAVPAARRAGPRTPTPRAVVFVGVQTAPTPDSAARRAALRGAWFPATAAALARAEAEGRVRARFVVGDAPDAAAEAVLAAEAKSYGPAFLRLRGHTEAYDALGNKSVAFFRAALRDAPGAAYIVKIDDDVFLRMDRVPAVAAQWGRMGVDVAGCAKNGPVLNDPALKWSEPAAALLGDSYYTHFWGSAYVLSARAAGAVAALAADGVAGLRARALANEDTQLGLWLLALAAAHYDDRRLCSPGCDGAAVAVYDYPTCAGLCDAVEALARLATDPACAGGGSDPPLVPELIRMQGL
jgi:galactosylxylosylprotein 3-beta-galactosyltransferase